MAIQNQNHNKKSLKSELGLNSKNSFLNIINTSKYEKDSLKLRRSSSDNINNSDNNNDNKYIDNDLKIKLKFIIFKHAYNFIDWLS